MKNQFPTTMKVLFPLFSAIPFFSSAQQCTQTMDICLEECECCDSGTAIKGDCDVSLPQYFDICSGDGSHIRDPSSYKLESKSIQTKEWNAIKEGVLIFQNRKNAVDAGETLPRECIRIAVNVDNFSIEHRFTFSNQLGTEFSGLMLHGTCGSEVCHGSLLT